MKKKVIIVILIIVILLLLIKFIQFRFFYKLKENMTIFNNKLNTWYSYIQSVTNEKITVIQFKYNNNNKSNIFFSKENNIIKQEFIIDNNCFSIFENSKKYKIENNNKIIFKPYNLPHSLDILDDIKVNFNNSNYFTIFDIFKIIYIRPSNYNNINCYKIKTINEILWVDRKTLYPIHLEFYQEDENNNKQKVEIDYEFKTDCVTEDDVKLPDLSEYTLIEE